MPTALQTLAEYQHYLIFYFILEFFDQLFHQFFQIVKHKQASFFKINGVGIFMQCQNQKKALKYSKKRCIIFYF